MITENEVEEVLRNHEKWLRGEGGERATIVGDDLTGANLTYANLRAANFRGTNFRGANFRGAKLTDANLTGANLTGANLTGTNLTGTNLTGANLTGTNLRHCVGNMQEVKTLHVERYSIAYTRTTLQIGCERHSPVVWQSFDDAAIAAMDVEALEWWRKWKDTIFKIIEMSPAE